MRETTFVRVVVDKNICY